MCKNKICPLFFDFLALTAVTCKGQKFKMFGICHSIDKTTRYKKSCSVLIYSHFFGLQIGEARLHRSNAEGELHRFAKKSVKKAKTLQFFYDRCPTDLCTADGLPSESLAKCVGVIVKKDRCRQVKEKKQCVL